MSVRNRQLEPGQVDNRDGRDQDHGGTGSETSWVGKVYRPARFRCASRWAANSVPHRSSGSAQAVLP